VPAATPPPLEARETAASAAAATPPAGSANAQSPAPTPAPDQLVSAEVREAQGRLRAVGFDPGPLDGSAGPMTANAAKQYQRARGLAVTGALDRDLLARLRQERTAAPPPPRQRYATATATTAPPPRQRNEFLDSLDRLFRR
jgi:peptidoglycan hydrolase-like protein with peptidoglycan-binding domain